MKRETLLSKTIAQLARLRWWNHEPPRQLTEDEVFWKEIQVWLDRWTSEHGIPCELESRSDLGAFRVHLGRPRFGHVKMTWGGRMSSPLVPTLPDLHFLLWNLDRNLKHLIRDHRESLNPGAPKSGV